MASLPPPPPTFASTASSSSCCSAGRRSALKQPGSNKAQQQRMYPFPRKVMFVAEKNTIVEFEAIDNDDHELVESLWQQPWEMHHCKQALKARARQWRTTGLGILLADVFLGGGATNDAGDNNDVNNNGQQQQVQLINPKLIQKQLLAFVRLPDELYNRGTERYLSRKHDEERTTLKRATIKEVVAQARTLKNNNSISRDEQAYYLGQFAQQLNRQAAVFARRIARADEAVMRKGCAENEQEAFQLVDFLIHVENQRLDQRARTAAAAAAAAEPKQKRRSSATTTKRRAAAATTTTTAAAPSSLKTTSAGVGSAPQQQPNVPYTGRRILQARQA